MSYRNVFLFYLMSLSLFCYAEQREPTGMQDYRFRDWTVQVPRDIVIPVIVLPSEKEADRIEGDVKSSKFPKTLVYYRDHKPFLRKKYNIEGELFIESYQDNAGCDLAIIKYSPGQKLRSITLFFPEGGDLCMYDDNKSGQFDHWDYRQDISNRIQIEDRNEDGRIDHKSTRENNALIERLRDKDANGEWDYIARYTHEGNPIYKKYLAASLRGTDTCYLEQKFDPHRNEYLLYEDQIIQSRTGGSITQIITEYSPESRFTILSETKRIDHNGNGSWDAVTVKKNGVAEGNEADTN